MSADVKPRRRYDSSRRQAQAAQTRDDVSAAAQEMFLDRGYATTTLANIAARAGVVVETIYRAFGGKAGLFKAVIEAAVAGGAARAEIPAEQRNAIRAVIAETDPRRQLGSTPPPSRVSTPGQAHSWASWRMRPANPDLPNCGASWKISGSPGMERFAQLLADRGALKPGLTTAEARDVLWTLNAHDIHDRLVVQRGWPPDRYRDWLARTLKHALLADPS